MAKGKKEGKNVKKEPGITLSDVKDANSAAAAAIEFPSDATLEEFKKETPEGNTEPQEEIGNTEPTQEEINVIETVIETVTESAIEAIEEIVDDTIIGVSPPVIPVNNVVDDNTPPVIPPTQDELEAIVLERWWNSKNRPTEINHFELANDINMGKFSAYEAVVGKFKFKRSHAGANWQITVDETK